MKKSTSGEAAKVTTMTARAWKRVTTIGIDLGDRFSHYCALDGNGEIVTEDRLATTRGAFELLFGKIAPVTMAIETGTHSPWISRCLAAFGHHVLVANARKLRLIYGNRKKNDRVDARSLARVARLDPQLLSAIRHRSAEAQNDLAVLRSRDALVATRTRLMSHLRGLIKAWGTRLPSASRSLYKVTVNQIPAALQPALAPILETILELNDRIKAFDQLIDRIIDERWPAARHLMQVAGVGPLTALAFVLTVEDPKRFARSRIAGAYLGLVPATDSSGQSDPQLRITKQGNPFLRRLLVQCAHYILGPFGKDCDLRRHGLAIAARGGKNAKRRAVVAVARKLAVLLCRLWRTGEEWQPLYNVEHRLKPAA